MQLPPAHPTARTSNADAPCTLARKDARDKLPERFPRASGPPPANSFSPLHAADRLILLDISRLLSRANRPTPTGIDRVELAYAQWVGAQGASAARFVARGPLGEITLLPTRLVRQLVARLAARWQGDAASPWTLRRLWLQAWWSLILHREWELHLWLWLKRASAVYLLVSHKDLDRPGSVARVKRISRARMACFVHDLIPMELPHFAGEGQAERHRRRMTTVARFADAVIVNSAPTAAALTAFCETLGRTPPVVVAPLGVQPHRMPPGFRRPDKPYFVVLATIEPKKNHALLLRIWLEHLRGGPEPPRLILIGERGWKTEVVAQVLDSAALPRDLIEERSSVSDSEAQALIQGARALLAPSYAEGFGLPVAEALALGTPVICSDIPAHRFVGGNVPEYLGADDAAAWLAAIREYAAEPSQRRTEQLARMSAWRAPTWDDHFAKAREALIPR
jgi:glycosyltransferase involved in cell wall biosynthesis